MLGDAARVLGRCWGVLCWGGGGTAAGCGGKERGRGGGFWGGAGVLGGCWRGGRAGIALLGGHAGEEPGVLGVVWGDAQASAGGGCWKGVEWIMSGRVQVS